MTVDGDRKERMFCGIAGVPLEGTDSHCHNFFIVDL